MLRNATDECSGILKVLKPEQDKKNKKKEQNSEEINREKNEKINLSLNILTVTLNVKKYLPIKCWRLQSRPIKNDPIDATYKKLPSALGI